MINKKYCKFYISPISILFSIVFFFFKNFFLFMLSIFYLLSRIEFNIRVHLFHLFFTMSFLRLVR